MDFEKYAKPGYRILDTHVGSGSSLIACRELGYQYVGFELDEAYYMAACRRIENHRNFQRKDDIEGQLSITQFMDLEKEYDGKLKGFRNDNCK